MSQAARPLEADREWEKAKVWVFDGVGRYWMDDVARVDAGEVNPSGGGVISGMAHPKTKKTQETADRIAQEIFGGMPAKWAAIYCGIGESTFFEWQAANPAFAELIKRARSARMRKYVKHVDSAAPITWLAAMTMLERLEFEDFGRTNKVRHSHEGTVNIDVRAMLASPTAIEHMAAIEAGMANPELPAHEE